MKIFWNRLKLIILKLEWEGKCLTSCTWCDEWIKESTNWFSFEWIKEIIDYSLKNLVTSDSKFFIYWKNIFKLSYYDELIKYVLGNSNINFDFHLTTFLDNNDLLKLENLLVINNITFTFCQSYSTIDFTILNKIIKILSNSHKKNQIVFIAEKDFSKIEKYFDDIAKKWNFELFISKYPIFYKNNVIWTWNKKCLVLDKFIPKDNYIDINWSILLEILINWDLRLHNYLCNLASIDITNVYKERTEIINDIKKFMYFFHKFHSKGSYESNCYKCIKKINYSYRKFN